MDLSDPPPPAPCACSCPCCGTSHPPSPSDYIVETDVARVEVENEAAALREALASHQQSIQDLYTELEEERNASSSAANEAMSMILRIQREKAEALMESRQFRRFAEEKMAHDQQEINALEDLLFKRDQAVQSLSCEVQAYKHRLASYGIAPIALGPVTEPQTPDSTASATFDYPALRCKTAVPDDFDFENEIDKFPFGESQTPIEHLQNLEQRIYQLERMPSSGRVMEKGVISQSRSPRRLRHLRRFSSGFSSLNKGEDSPVTIDRATDHGWRDDVSDRVYTVDAVHGAGGEDYTSTPREFVRKQGDGGGDAEDGEIKKLYMRLQALEADRESMRQTIISMGTDNAQMVLLKEIAQQLCKEAPPPVPEKRVVKKSSFVRTFSIMTVVKWITSFIFWRKRSTRIKYTFGMTSNNSGLLLLLQKSPRSRLRRSMSRTQG